MKQTQNGNKITQKHDHTKKTHDHTTEKKDRLDLSRVVNKNQKKPTMA